MKLFKSNLILCSCVIVAAISMSAQAEGMIQLNNSVFVQAGSPAADITVESYSVPSVADFDGDGLLDLVVGEAINIPFVGKVRLYHNFGTADAPVYGGFVFAQTASGDLSVPRGGCLGIFPQLVDWNLDGKLDLLAGLGDGTVMIFLNIGTTTNPVFDNGTNLTSGPAGSKLNIDIGSRATPVLADWNNDGKRDLIVGAVDGKVHLYINEGTDVSPDYLTMQFIQSGAADLLVTAGRSSPVVVDIDGDGLKDLVSGETDGKLHCFLNVGTDAAPVFSGSITLTAGGQVINTGISSRSRPFVCDYNHDGRLDILVGAFDGKVHLFTGVSTIALGGRRLAELQNTDGAWDWPLDDGDPLTGSQTDTLGSIGLGLASAYRNTGDPALRTALLSAGQYLLQKTDDFYANEGAFAAALDSIFNTTEYSTHVRTAFYDKLAAGTYTDARFDPPVPNMTTAMYIQSKRDRCLDDNVNDAWDLGLCLYDAWSVGAPTAPWADAAKTSIEQIDFNKGYDVLGLAGALYGLASAGIECDPLTGPFTAADNLGDLADILVSYQFLTGGFTYSHLAREENMGYETLGETAYAARALKAVDHNRFWTAIRKADDYIVSVQLSTGGWEFFVGDPWGEYNMATGDALVALQATGFRAGDMDANGKVDLRDLAILAQNWDRSNCGDCNNADVNGDHAVDLIDLLMLSDNWMNN